MVKLQSFVLGTTVTEVTVIASPEDADDFIARGGLSTVDRLRKTPQPARLVATPTGDHSAYHPAIWLAIREAVLAVVAGPASERTPAENPLAANGNHLMWAARQHRGAEA